MQAPIHEALNSNKSSLKTIRESPEMTMEDPMPTIRSLNTWQKLSKKKLSSLISKAHKLRKNLSLSLKKNLKSLRNPNKNQRFSK